MGWLNDFFGLFDEQKEGKEKQPRSLTDADWQKLMEAGETSIEANPWVDPISAFVGSTTGSLMMGSGIVRGIVNGTIAAVSDIPAGTMI
ncbi:MAG: hypothetical protein ACC656_04690, partial [Candidatus Heimdallarchaeota archaeon]